MESTIVNCFLEAKGFDQVHGIHSAAYGCTPMLVACFEGRLDVAELLYDLGAADDVRTPSLEDGDTPMMGAC